MDIERFQSLENRIEEKSFARAHAGKSKLWYCGGLFFQFVNIGICFLGLYWFLSGIFPDFSGKNALFGLLSILLLLLWEFLKRSTVLELATKLLKNKLALKSSYLPLLCLAIFLIGGSGYMAVRGAKEIADTSHTLETNADTRLTSVSDSIEAQFSRRIEALEKQGQQYVALAAEKGRPMNRREAEQVDAWAEQAKGLRQERDAKLQALAARTQQTLVRDKGHVASNSLTFLIMTLGIEATILFCIFYGARYDYESYREATTDPTFQQLRTNLQLLDLIYQNGKITQGADCFSSLRVAELARLKPTSVISTADIQGFFAVTTAVGITKTSGGKRRLLVDYNRALELLKENYAA
jgi:hypothetical protein